MQKQKFLLQLLIIALVSILQACANDGGKWNPNDYTVKSGDTVYSIAWRYELDPIEFAGWNNIATDEFLIHPGQRLHIHKPAGFNRHNRHSASTEVRKKSGLPIPARQRPKWIKVQSGDTLYAVSKQYNISIPKLVQLNGLSKPYLIQPGHRLYLQPLHSKPAYTAPRSVHNSRNRAKPIIAVNRSAVKRPGQNWPTSIHWQWPVRGKIVSRYASTKHNTKGIDIRGNMGSRINAAASGKVVYSGNGLISYGNLIIIKHNKHYLSAYAYNHKLLVHEGQRVKAGQQIAEMGRSGNSSPRLHFEIRRNGKPVNPQSYLPR